MPQQQSTRAVLEDLIDACQTGDNDRLAARIHDDIDRLFYAPIALFPLAGARRGKAQAFKGFARMYEALRPVGHEVRKKVVEGDRSATHSEARMEQRATGRGIHSHIANFQRFQDGKMIEYRGVTDSFDALEQVLGHEIDVRRRRPAGETLAALLDRAARIAGPHRN